MAFRAQIITVGEPHSLASMSTEDLSWLSTAPSGQDCPLAWLSMCQGRCCLTPAHGLHGQCTRQSSPLSTPSVERVQQLWVPGLGAQPLDPVQQLPTNALQSQQGTPPTFPRWCLRPGPAGGCVVSRPHTLCSPLCLIQFPIHTQLGVQLPPKLGIRFFMWHFSSPRRGLQLFSSLGVPGSAICVLH